jgi:hypothetical protein
VFRRQHSPAIASVVHVHAARTCRSEHQRRKRSVTPWVPRHPRHPLPLHRPRLAHAATGASHMFQVQSIASTPLPPADSPPREFQGGTGRTSPTRQAPCIAPPPTPRGLLKALCPAPPRPFTESIPNNNIACETKDVEALAGPAISTVHVTGVRCFAAGGWIRGGGCRDVGVLTVGSNFQQHTYRF